MGKQKERSPVIVEREGIKTKVHLAVIRVKEYPQMTQEEFANHIGIGKTTLSRIEKGHMLPGLPMALMIAYNLKKPVEKIFEYLPD